ncbi:MAG: DUF4314 domain-containing protein, partial [Bacteroidales bacterium]
THNRRWIMNSITPELLMQIRKRYPKGIRVELIRMDDPYTRLVKGDRGTVEFVDDIGTIHISWDCGSTLGLVYGVDACRVLEQ